MFKAFLTIYVAGTLSTNHILSGTSESCDLCIFSEFAVQKVRNNVFIGVSKQHHYTIEIQKMEILGYMQFMVQSYGTMELNNLLVNAFIFDIVRCMDN